MKRSGGISGTSWGSRRPCTLPLRTLPAPAPRSAKAKVSPSPSQLPALCSRSARSGQAAPGARQSSIYCLVSTVTRRRRQSLPSAAPTRRRDVCPPLPLCPYLERRGGWGRAGSRTPAAPRPLPGSAPARARGALGRTRTPPPTRTLRRRAWGGWGRQHPPGSARGGCSQSLGPGSSVFGWVIRDHDFLPLCPEILEAVVAVVA